MATTAETVFNITRMTAELPLTVSVDLKYFAAVRTGKGIDRLSLHQVKMHVPPLVPAGIAAEPFPLPPRILGNGLSALFAYCSGCFSYQTVSPAERLHSVDGNLELHRYPAIPCPIPAQGNDLLFLFVRHDGYLLKIWSSGVTGQNGYR